MSSKILVADDSLTIQKVIGITLANSGYQLTESIREDDLLNKVNNNSFDLILLDFNLSDAKSGYDLALEIKKAQPNAGIIVMLGTFDSVDESRFAECGINDKIIKPFESSKFIKKCRDVLENSTTFEFTPKATSTTGPKEENEIDLDSWVVDAPKKEDVLVLQEEETSDELNLDPLNSEIQGWGFDPKSNNLEEKFNKTFPSVIDEVVPNVVERLQSSSNFVEEIELNSIDDDSTDPSFELPQDLKRDLLSEIDLEVSAEAFWAVDEVVPVKAEAAQMIQETHLDEVTADLTDTVNQFKKAQEAEKAEVIAVPNINMDELVAKLKVALLPHVESMVKDFCKESAEKVSWEVIPDLAENLIKKEIKNIADSIH